MSYYVSFSHMFEVPKVPEALDEIHHRNARYGGGASLEGPGYEEAMKLCDNMTGSGTAYGTVAEECEIDEQEMQRTILLPEDVLRHGPYDDRVPGDKTIRRIAGTDVITFPSNSGTEDAMGELRRVIPPTLPVPLSKALIRKLLGDKTDDRRRRDKIKLFLETARGEPLRAPVDDESPPVTGDFDDDLLASGTEVDERASRDYIRRLIASSRGLNPDEMTLFYGAEEALMTIAQWCRRAFADVMTISIPPHDYSRFMKFADFLGFRIAPLGIDYGDITHTAFDPSSSIFYFSSPRNPDGNVLHPEEVAALMATLPERATIVLDNTSISYEYSVREYTTEMRSLMLKSDTQRGQRLILTGSLSKEEQSPWLRTGYAASIDTDLNQRLRNVEAHISPNLGRVISNRLRWIGQKDVRTEEREYMRGFYETLRGIENRSDGRMRIFRPETAASDRWPSGYHCVIELPSGNDADTFQSTVTALGEEIFGVPVKPPMRGSNQRTSIPTTELNRDTFNRSGMPYMSASSFRLVTTGPAFQLTALARTLGIE